MPKTKLTLYVDSTVVERAKRYSKRSQTSVSQLVSEYLGALGDGDQPAAPIASRLRGVLPSDVTVQEYRAHLEKKHG